MLAIATLKSFLLLYSCEQTFIVILIILPQHVLVLHIYYPSGITFCIHYIKCSAQYKICQGIIRPFYINRRPGLLPFGLSLLLVELLTSYIGQ